MFDMIHDAQDIARYKNQIQRFRWIRLQFGIKIHAFEYLDVYTKIFHFDIDLVCAAFY